MDDVIEGGSVPQAVEDAFSAMFGGSGSESGATEVEAVSAEPARSPLSRDGETQEEADELEQIGETDLDNPDGSLEAGEEPAVEGEQTETVESSDKPVAGAKPAAAVETPALDPYLRYIAKEAGWTDEKINKLVTADAELASDTFQHLADAFVATSRQFVTPGSPVAPGTQAANQPAQPDASPTPKLDKFMSELSGFAEENGEALAGFVKALDAEVIQPFKAQMAAAAVAGQQTMRSEAVNAFEAVRKDFGDFYGPADGKLSDGQSNARQQLATLADQIRAGAAAQGKQMPVQDAIKRAHAVVTAELRASTARREVVKQVEKRAKTITSKPTQRRNPATVGDKSREAAQAAYTASAAAMGLELDEY